MDDSELYERVEVGTAKKLELEMIKRNAQDMLKHLK